MAKPQTRAERKREETRREIIDAAFDCFAEKGYHGTGIADIAARLGIGHGTFYRYFQNKRDIVDHVMDEMLGRIVAALSTENAPDAANTLEEYRAQTARIGEALTDILAADPRVPQFLLTGATGIDTELNLRMFGVLDTANVLTLAYLEHGVERGYLRSDLDAAHTAHAINGLILSSIIFSLRAQAFGLPHGELPPDHADLSTAIQRLIFDGIRAPA